MYHNLNPRVLLWLAIAIGVVTLFPFLASVPGLQGDEAWAGLRAVDIVNGLRPTIGMNEYTGPFHQYLIAALFGLIGHSVTALRLITAMSFLLVIPLYYRVSHYFFDEITAAIAVLVLVTS